MLMTCTGCGRPSANTQLMEDGYYCADCASRSVSLAAYVAKQVKPSDIAAAIHAIRAKYAATYAAQFDLAGDSVIEMTKANAKLQACGEIFAEIYSEIHKIIQA